MNLQKVPKEDCPSIVQYSKFRMSSENKGKLLGVSPCIHEKGSYILLRYNGGTVTESIFPPRGIERGIGLKRDLNPAGKTLHPTGPCPAYRVHWGRKCAPMSWTALPLWHCCFSPHDHFLGWLYLREACSFPWQAFHNSGIDFPVVSILVLPSSPQIHVLPSKELLIGTGTCHILPCFPGFPLKYW